MPRRKSDKLFSGFLLIDNEEDRDSVKEPLERKLKAVTKALNSPENKWQERDRDWLYGARDTLLWVLGLHVEPFSPEGDI